MGRVPEGCVPRKLRSGMLWMVAKSHVAPSKKPWEGMFFVGTYREIESFKGVLDGAISGFRNHPQYHRVLFESASRLQCGKILKAFPGLQVATIGSQVSF